jgi:hypothetical protein
MKSLTSATLLAALMQCGPTLAQQAPDPATQPFEAGLPLGVVQDGETIPISDNVKVFGAIVNAESCVYDETRDLILAVNRGVNQNQVANDGFVSLINHDGSVHTARWIGVNRNGLTLNQPFGSDISGGKLYLADRDGGTSDADPSVSVVRIFDIATGAPAGELRTAESTGFNDIEVTDDGTIYATQTGSGTPPDPTTFKVFKVTPDGQSSVVVEGAPLNRPNGIALDGAGNLVVVNIGDNTVLTFSVDGELVATEEAAQDGNDGLVIMQDGTKYVSSVLRGGVSRIPAGGGAAELIATGIPSAASMCYDAGANQLVIPMNPNNTMAFIKLD